MPSFRLLHQSFTFLMILSDTTMGMLFLLFNNPHESRKNTLCVPCMFPVCTKSMHSSVLGVVLFVICGSSWVSTYNQKTTLQWFLKSRCRPVNILLGDYFCEITLTSVRKLNHIKIKYIRWIVIFDVWQYYGNLLMIPLERYFTVLIFIHTSFTCSSDAKKC